MESDILNWKEEYSVGLETVDNQHKKFLGIINELGSCLEKQACSVNGHQMFFSLLHFADTFLLKEKMLVNAVNDLDYSFFREKHAEFLQKLEDFQAKYDKENPREVFSELHLFLKQQFPVFLSCYTPSLVSILKEHGVN